MLKKYLFFIDIFFFAFLFEIVNCEERYSGQKVFNEETSKIIQKALSSLPGEKIPKEFKINLESRDNSNWCCKINSPVIQVEQTRLVATNVVNSGPHRCGYQSCGFLGWGSCTRWCTSYWTETVYHIEHYTVTQQVQCPVEYITCCTDFFLIHNHCFHLSEVQGNLELLTALNDLGIVIPPGK